MYIVDFSTALLLAVIGAVVKYKKASWLIAGYNTSSKEEKEKYDEGALCRFVGNLLFALAAIVFFMGLAGLLNLPYFMWVLGVGWTVFVLVIIGAVIYMNTGNRFKKTDR